MGPASRGESANARDPAPVHPLAWLSAGPRLHFRGRSRWHAVGSAARCLRPDYPRPPRLTALIDQQQMASLGSGDARQSLALGARASPDGAGLPLRLSRRRHRVPAAPGSERQHPAQLGTGVVGAANARHRRRRQAGIPPSTLLPAWRSCVPTFVGTRFCPLAQLCDWLVN